MCATKLEPDQQLDALKFISQTQRSLHEQRMKHELKAFFTIATLLVLIGAARFTNNSAFSQPMPAYLVYVIWCFILLMALSSTFYLNGLHRANIINKEFAHKAEDHIRELLKANGLNIDEPPGAERRNALTRLWQPIIIWILALAAAFLVTR